MDTGTAGTDNEYVPGGRQTRLFPVDIFLIMLGFLQKEAEYNHEREVYEPFDKDCRRGEGLLPYGDKDISRRQEQNDSAADYTRYKPDKIPRRGIPPQFPVDPGKRKAGRPQDHRGHHEGHDKRQIGLAKMGRPEAQYAGKDHGDKCQKNIGENNRPVTYLHRTNFTCGLTTLL